MMRHPHHPASALVTLLVLAVVRPIGAQELAVPEGWTARLDAPQQLVGGQDVAMGEWRYVRMPPGWHMTTTGEGVSVFPEQRTMHGRWGIEVELFLFPNPSDAPFGIVLSNALTHDGEPKEVRVLMRKDGAVALIAHNAGMTEVGVPWQADTTGTLAHNGTSVTRYVLRAVHESGHLVFSVNGTERFAFPTGGEDHVVIPGFRMGPGLNVHISRYDVIEPLAPARVRSEQ